MLFSIQEITDRAEKQRFLEECDDAYTISVIGRSFYPELFEKLNTKAIILGIYTDTNMTAGYSAFYANDMENQKAFLTLFCIKKTMQRNHLGSLLMQRTLEEAKKRGMTKIGLEVLKEDAGAILFYKHMGFYESGQGHNSFLIMERKI